MSSPRELSEGLRAEEKQDEKMQNLQNESKTKQKRALMGAENRRKCDEDAR